MLAKNNSYFDVELCLEGHYIVTGYTNDQFCNDRLQLSDVKYELHNYLRHREHFDAVFFLDSINMLFCYDQQSFDILRGLKSSSSIISPFEGEAFFISQIYDIFSFFSAFSNLNSLS